MKLSGKVALVTGAAQGIGRAIAELLAAEGAKVAAVDSQDFVAGPGLTPYLFDLSLTREIPSLVKTIEATLGNLDILVNCAGICPTRPLFDCDEATWRKVFDINVHAPFFLTKAAASSMIARRQGVVVNLASVSAFLPKLEQIDYGASKAALVSLTRSFAAILGPYGVRVNALAPGMIDTPLTRNIAETRSKLRGVSAEETQRPVIEATPLRRRGEAREVAAAALFLVGPESAFITGQTLDVCGGQLMR